MSQYLEFLRYVVENDHKMFKKKVEKKLIKIPQTYFGNKLPVLIGGKMDIDLDG